MSKWDGCPVVSCKNDLCDLECRHLKLQKGLEVAAEMLAVLGVSAAEWDREREIAEGMNQLNPHPLPR